MTSEFLNDGFNHVALFFGGTYPQQSIDLMIDELAPLPNEAFTAATKRAFTELPPKYLPPIRKLADLIKEEAGKLNLAAGDRVEREAEARRRETDRQTRGRSIFDLATQLQHADLASRIHAGYASRKLNREQYIDAFLHMEAKFPGCGWREAAAQRANDFRMSDEAAA